MVSEKEDKIGGSIIKDNLDDLTNKLDQQDIIMNKSELAEIFDNLDDDRQNKENNMSQIDFNTRLTTVEINSIMIIDEFTRLGIFPPDAGITRQKKRLAISKDGEGRKEKVHMVAGKEESRSGNGFLKNLFSRRE